MPITVERDPPKESRCIACRQFVGQGDYAAKFGRRLALHLCEGCWQKVARGGRKPRQTIEAVDLYLLDPDVGGPDDPLDHEDYRDLELLGLWPEAGD